MGELGSPLGTPPTHFRDAEDDGDAESLCSAMSHDSDFDEDDDADYFALEIVNHLPPEKASRFMRSLRAKEKAVQDLLRRNQRLLGSCQKLDEENQSLEERLKDAEDAPPSSASADLKPLAAPVDTSIFAQMERGKEERILKLTAENQKMAMHMRRVDENNVRLDESLQQAQKELKRLSKMKTTEQAQRAQPDEEEDRLYRKLQEEAAGDLIVQRFQNQQAEQRGQLQDALRALLREDMKRIGAWGSDVAALLLAVDGVETKIRGGKASGSKAVGAAGKKAAKAAAAANSGGGGSSSWPSSDEVLETSTRLLDDFDSLRAGLGGAERTQLALEQTIGGLRDGAETAAAALDLDGNLATAEKEAEWIREHNACWVDRVQALSLGPTAELLGQTEAACRAMFEGAPPGLIPPHVDACIQETCGQLSALRGKITGQSQELDGLQEASVSLGRRVKTLQAAQRAHRSGLQSRVAEEIRSIVGAVEGPLEGVRDTLRRQREMLTKSRQKTSSCLEDLAAAVRRSATNPHFSRGAAESGALSEVGADHLLQEVREVRAMGKAMVTSLNEGAKVLETRMDQVLAAVVGEAPPSKGGSAAKIVAGGQAAEDLSGHREGTSAASAQSKAQRKKANKKAAAGSGNPAVSTVAAAAAADQPLVVAGKPERQNQQTPQQKEKGGADEDSETRAEFLAAFAGGEAGKKKKAPAPAPAPQPVKAVENSPRAGPELLRELQALRDGAEALEARMTARMATRTAGGEMGEEAAEDPGLEEMEEAPEAKPAVVARRKKRYD